MTLDTKAISTPTLNRHTKSAARARRAPLLPALIFVIIMTQLPFVALLGVSVFNWEATRPDKRGFIGFENYLEVFSDPRMLGAVANTVTLTVSVVGISLALGLGIAMLLNRKFVGRGIVRTMMIAPFLIVPVAAALMFKHVIFSYSNGLVNGILTLTWKLFNAGPPPQISIVVDAPLMSIALVLIWQWTPFMMLILLAGLQSQSKETLEAASIDGAGSGAVFRYITFPHLNIYLQLATLLGSIYIIQNFDIVRTMTEGGLGSANLPYLIYQTFSQGGNYGLASAQGVMTVIGSIIVATFALRATSSLLKSEAN